MFFDFYYYVQLLSYWQNYFIRCQGRVGMKGSIVEPTGTEHLWPWVNFLFLKL